MNKNTKNNGLPASSLASATWQLLDSHPRKLPQGPRYSHATVSLFDGTLVVLGEYDANSARQASVLVYYSSHSKNHSGEWWEGPIMTMARADHCAQVCNGFVYAMGGEDTRSVERIPISAFSAQQTNPRALSAASSTTRTTTRTRTKASTRATWQTMPYQLSHGRSGSASVMVRNRFLVLLGGRDDTVYETPDVKALATLDIIDTVHSVVVTNAGPSMKVARRICGACLVNETTLWVVGGTDCYHGTDITLNSVESIDLHKNPRLMVVPNKQSPPRPRL